MSTNPPPDPRRILIVDDEADIGISLKALYERDLPSVEVHVAGSAEEGLAALRQMVPDLVISDYWMPHMDGIEFLEKVRRWFPGVPRALITAYPDLEVMEKAVKQARIHHCFLKPVEKVRFLEETEELLRGRDDGSR